MQIQKQAIYNSLTKKKTLFKPLNEKYVGMYVCGPTVYSNVHLGNMRTFISFDIIFRYFQFLGYKTRYVRNITDAGHLENDADQGEDRIAKSARLEQLEPMEIAQRYTTDFHKNLQLLNCLPPSIEPIATGHIIEQIAIIQKIIKQGYAYIKKGSVYFNVKKYNKKHKYSELSNRNIENLIHNTRSLDGQTDKKNPQDFALWKKADSQHIMRWSSPWSDGFPGWHLECTAMSMKYLGDSFDIHGGGMDLKFPHHECEIAQAKAVNSSNSVNYWIHTNMLTLNGQKMAKSTKNNILPSEIFTGNNTILKKPFSPEVVRFFILQAHYRSILDFSSKALGSAEKGYQRLISAIQLLPDLPTSSRTSFDLKKWEKDCFESMNDDFNTPILIAHLFEAVKYIQHIHLKNETITKADLESFSSTINNFFFDVLGLKLPISNLENTGKSFELINLIIEIRNQARENKDFKTSDKIRDKLNELNIEVKDNKDHTSFNL